MKNRNEQMRGLHDSREHVNPELNQLFLTKIEQYLSVKDISVLYGVPEKTVRGWIYKRILIPERLGPRLIRFKKSYIEQWISQQMGESNGNN